MRKKNYKQNWSSDKFCYKIILLWDMELTVKYYEGGRYGTDTCTAQYLHNA